jgi:hypothetical protein
MGERGQVLHVRGSGGARLLRGVNVPCAFLAANRRWASFVPLAGGEIDEATVAGGAGADVVRVWFDDDSGVVLQFSGPDGFVGELAVPRGDADGLGVEDQRLIADLAGRKLLSATSAKKLAAWLAEPASVRDAWADRHGVEELFGFPFVRAIPVEADQTLVLELAPGATIVSPKPGAGAGRSAAATTTSPAPLPPGPLPDEARPVVDLHVYYWTNVWSMNNWKLYNRYKKHLPAKERSDVDELAGAVGSGAHHEIPERVTSILTRIWAAEDWDAVIRSPSLDDDGSGDAELNAWRRLTGRG